MTRIPAPLELHIVIDRLGFVRDQDATQPLDVIVKDIMDGQFSDAHKIVAIKFGKCFPGESVAQDVTSSVAWEIYKRCDGLRYYILYDSAAYHIVEQHCGIAYARKCLDQWLIIRGIPESSTD